MDNYFYNNIGDYMKIKLFDEESEKDLEEEMNDILEYLNGDIIDIKYQVSSCIYNEEQIYCFSAMIIYQWLILWYNYIVGR